MGMQGDRSLFPPLKKAQSNRNKKNKRKLIISTSSEINSEAAKSKTNNLPQNGRKLITSTSSEINSEAAKGKTNSLP
jgi:hypothetical protein